MPPAAPVPTTAPPTSKNSVVRNPPPLGGGGTFRTVSAMKVATNCPFAFVVPVDGVTLPAPEVRVMLMDAPSTGIPFESRTVTVIGALPPEPTADGMLAADRITPGGAGSSKIRDQ